MILFAYALDDVLYQDLDLQTLHHLQPIIIFVTQSSRRGSYSIVFFHCTVFESRCIACVRPEVCMYGQRGERGRVSGDPPPPPPSLVMLPHRPASSRPARRQQRGAQPAQLSQHAQPVQSPLTLPSLQVDLEYRRAVSKRQCVCVVHQFVTSPRGTLCFTLVGSAAKQVSP